MTNDKGMDWDIQNTIAGAMIELAEHGLDVTPAIARHLLGNAAPNRKISNKVVERYASDMKSGLWVQDSGGCFTFDENGQMVGGQHRCYAVIKSGATIRVLLIKGVSHESRAVEDGGRRMTPGDWLNMTGWKNGGQIVAAGRMLFDYESGAIKSKDHKAHQSDATMRAFCEKRPGLEEANEYAKLLKHLLSGARATFLFYILSRTNRAATETFFNRLSDGAGLAADSPILLLRTRLLMRRADKGRTTVDAYETCAWTVKAWNAWRANKAIKSLRWVAGEPFPTPK